MTPFEKRLARLEAEHEEIKILAERQGHLILELMGGMTLLAQGGAATNAHLNRTMEATTMLLGLVAGQPTLDPVGAPLVDVLDRRTRETWDAWEIDHPAA